MRKLRIFWNSNAPWSMSGYGNQMAELLPLMVKEGFPVAQCDFFGLQGGKLFLDGVQHYPIINHIYGSDALIHHAKNFQADVVFTLQDTWVLNPTDLQQVNRFIPIVPIDHDPVTQPVLGNLRYAYKIITYAKHGHDQLLKNGLVSTYIPHTVNTEIFNPMDKAKRKLESGLPADCFLIGMVAANKDNPPRKSFQEAIDAFFEFLKVEPKALLYIHSNPQFPGGFDFYSYAKFLGIQDKVLYPKDYDLNFTISKAHMANVYNTFDVYLHPSASEGFGVPIIEAQACGIPAIVNNFTSMPELIIPEDTGYLIELGSKRFTQQGSYWGIPSTKSILDNLVKIHKVNRLEMGKRARKFIVENFDTQKVWKEKWIPYLDTLEEEVYGPLAKEDKKEVK